MPRKIRLLRDDQRGQALAELSIMGSILLVVVAAMLSNWNYLRNQQDVEMESFRRAVFYAEKSGAHFESGGGDYPNHHGSNVGYTVMRDYPFFNLFNFGSQNRNKISGSSFVIWSEGAQSTNYNYIHVNSDAIQDFGDDRAREEPLWSGWSDFDYGGEDVK